MTSIPATGAVARRRWEHVRRGDVLRLAVPVAALAAVLALVVIGLLGESYATLPVRMSVLSTDDPLQIGAATNIRLQVTNKATHDIHPRFSVSWLPYPFYWDIDSGPATLAAGQTATYEIRAPEAVAAPHDGMKFQVKVNDATSITYAESSPIVRGNTPKEIVNPGLQMWTDHDPVTGLLQPAGWKIYTSRGDGDVTDVGPVADGNAQVTRFHLIQDGKPDPGDYAAAGLTQDVPFPKAPFTIRVNSDVPYRAITDGWLVTAFGLEFSRGDHERIWVLFQHTGIGNREYDLPNGHHIKVYDVPLGQWTDVSVDLQAMYKQLNWRAPDIITMKTFIAASSLQPTEIEGEIAGFTPSAAPGGQ